MKKLLKFRHCSIIVFLICIYCSQSRADEPKWKWILMDVYWNTMGGQVCEFKQIGTTKRVYIVRKRGYGCASKSMNPYKEP